MNDTLAFALLGFIGAGLVEGLAVVVIVTQWITYECSEQGPDYVGDNLLKKVGWIWVWSAVILVVFGVFDYFRHATVLEQLKKIPLFADRGDPLEFSVALWLGALGGLLVGVFIGRFIAVSMCPKSRSLLAPSSYQKQ